MPRKTIVKLTVDAGFAPNACSIGWEGDYEFVTLDVCDGDQLPPGAVMHVDGDLPVASITFVGVDAARVAARNPEFWALLQTRMREHQLELARSK